MHYCTIRCLTPGKRPRKGLSGVARLQRDVVDLVGGRLGLHAADDDVLAPGCGQPRAAPNLILSPLLFDCGDRLCQREGYRTASTPPSLKQIAGYRALARNEVRRLLHD
jgi:hypothetical protein